VHLDPGRHPRWIVGERRRRVDDGARLATAGAYGRLSGTKNEASKFVWRIPRGAFGDLRSVRPEMTGIVICEL